MSKYCIHPYIGLSLTETNAKLNPCCIFQQGQLPSLFEVDTLNNLHNRPEYIDIQKKLNDGIEIPECTRCNSREKFNIKSKRQQSNRMYSKSDIKFGYLQDLEIAIDYTCNMMCRMCSPVASSKWGSSKNLLTQLKQQGIEYEPIKKNTYKSYQEQFQKVFNNTSFKYMKQIKIEGGEPFYAKNLEWFLEKLYSESVDKSKVKVNIFSNGSIFPNSNILKKLESFNTSITFSLDAYGDLATLIRAGVKWKDIEKSLHKWVYYSKNNNIDLCTNTTLNIMNINMIDPLLEFCNDLKIDVNYNDLHYPNYLSMYQLPLHIRQRWQDSRKKKTFNKFLLADRTAEQEFDQFIKFTTIFDNHQHMSFSKVNSEMHDIITSIKGL